MKKIPDDNDTLSSSSKVSDWVKKTLLTGVGAVFMTEEGIRNALSDLKMPKNVITAAVNQADKTKREVMAMITKEVGQFLGRLKVEEIIQKALAGQTIEINATIKFKRPESKKNAAQKAAKSETIDEP